MWCVVLYIHLRWRKFLCNSFSVNFRGVQKTPDGNIKFRGTGKGMEEEGKGTGKEGKGSSTSLVQPSSPVGRGCHLSRGRISPY